MGEVKLWAVPLLVIAVIAVSSAGPAFHFLRQFNPILTAAWRLEVTFAIQLPLAIYQRVSNPTACSVLWEGYNPLLVIASGLSLGLHFSLWVWSLSLTSLAESLLFVTVSPILLIAGMLAMCKKVAKRELIGTGIGFVGCAMVAFGSGSTAGSSAFGDFTALLGAAAICIYLLVGRYMREQRKVALFYYLCPISLLATLTSYICAIGYDEKAAEEVFEWVGNREMIYVIYLGLVPGVIGHALLNFLLLHISPLIISLFVTLEPVVGSVMGWMIGIQDIPNWLIWAGGAAILIGNIVVTVSPSDGKSLQQPLREELKEDL